MTTKELADHFKMSQSRIQILVRTGKIEAEKIGRDWHVHPLEIHRWRKEQHGKKSWLVPVKAVENNE